MSLISEKIMDQKCVVAKFGGTSVANYEAMERCVDIVLANPDTRLILVSASSGVTNLLVSLTKQHSKPESRQDLLGQIRTIQGQILDRLARPQTLVDYISQLISQIEDLSESLAAQPDKKKIDQLLSIGELCSSSLFAAVLNRRAIQQGERASVFDVRKVMRTDSHFGRAQPLIDEISDLAQRELAPLLANERIVTQGFMGADSQGQTTTLGRGGSDYSAALLAEALKAEALEIWTDVAGIYTTDPRMASKAHPIEEISFNEAAEMATFGAKVLHPATILPAARQKIEVFIGSSREPQKGGTWIRHAISKAPVYRAIAVRREQTLVNLHSLNMLHSQGFLAQTFTTLAKHKISVDLITTSEVNVALTLDKTGSDSAGRSLLSEVVISELSEHCQVKTEDDLALVAIIGNRIATTPGVCRRIFTLLEPHNVRMICQGASPHNLCVLVSENEVVEVVRALHENLFEAL